MGRSQRHLRERAGVDSSGQTKASAGETPRGALRYKLFTEDLAGQTVNFKTAYPTGTNFAVSDIPAGMSLNATTGLLNGTPTTPEVGTDPELTVTYTVNGKSRTHVAQWGWAVSKAVLAASNLTVDVGSQDVNFGTSFPGAVRFALSSKPVGMTLNARTGVLGGTPTVEDTDTATLTVTYPEGNVATVDWDWTVAAA